MTNIWYGNIDKITNENDYYRKVLHTSTHQQIVVMCLKDNEDIPEEIHKNHDQFIKIVDGQAKVEITKNNNRELIILNHGDSIIIPCNTTHKVINGLKKPLKLYTIYSPPEHEYSRIDKRKPIKGGNIYRRIRI